jgi:phospholipase/carboxylesterase
MKIEMQKVAGLSCVVKPGQLNAPAILLFHGYGADQHDLAPLSDYMGLGPKYSWYFPNGPMEVIVAPGMKGRAWYPVNMERLRALVMEGEHADLRGSRPQGMDSAVELGLRLLSDVQTRHSHVFIGGFSQGAILANEIALKAQQKPKGLILLSGNLVDQEGIRKLAANAKGLPFIQSHGVNDVILSHAGAEALYNELTSAGLKGKFLSFRGGHEIPPQVLKEVSSFIAAHS